MVKNPYTVPRSHTSQSIVHHAVDNNLRPLLPATAENPGEASQRFARLFVQCTVSTYAIGAVYKCDLALENRAYVHIKFAHFFGL